LELDNNPQYQFRFFSRVLKGQACAHFSSIRDPYQLVDDFDGCLRHFMSRAGFLHTGDRNQQLSYLNHAPKPFKMSVAQFHNRLVVLFAYAKMMPGPTNALGDPVDDPRTSPDEHAMKALIHNAMPATFKTAFACSNQHLSTVSLPHLIAYFDTIRHVQDGTGSARPRARTTVPTTLPADKRSATSDAADAATDGPAPVVENTSSPSKKVKPTPTETCPIPQHANSTHTWEQCIFNPKGPNYRTFPKPAAARTVASTSDSSDPGSIHTSAFVASASTRGTPTAPVASSPRVSWQMPSDGEEDD
jgi:hypothetical protein